MTQFSSPDSRSSPSPPGTSPTTRTNHRRYDHYPNNTRSPRPNTPPSYYDNFRCISRSRSGGRRLPPPPAPLSSCTNHGRSDRGREGEYESRMRLRSPSPPMMPGRYVSPPGRSVSPRRGIRKDDHTYGSNRRNVERPASGQCQSGSRSPPGRGGTAEWRTYKEVPYREEERGDEYGYNRCIRGERRRVDYHRGSHRRDDSRERDDESVERGSDGGGRYRRRWEYDRKEDSRMESSGRGQTDYDYKEYTDRRRTSSRERRGSRGDRSELGPARSILVRKRDDDTWPAPSATVIVQNIPEDYTDEQVEECVRTVSIQKGFSLPESISLGRSGFPAHCREQAGVASVLEEGELPMLTETVAYVQFPSIDAATRFIRSCRHKKLPVANRMCAVDFAPPHAAESAITSSDANAGRTADDGSGGDAHIARILNRDWICLNCSYTNFSKRVQCLSCKSPKTACCPVVVSARVAPPKDSLDVYHRGRSTDNTSVTNLAASTFPWSGATIMISNVPDRSTIESVKETFNAMGSVKDVRYVPGGHMSETTGGGDRGNNDPYRDDVIMRDNQISSYFLVEYFSENDALRALNRFESTGCVMDGKRVEARYCRCSGSQQVAHGAGSRSKDIFLPGGLPDISEFKSDPVSGYLFHRQLNLYYDRSTDLCMNEAGDYFRWTAKSSTLTNIYSLVQTGDKEDSELLASSTGSTVPPISDVQLPELYVPPTTSAASAVASLVAAAQKTAKASKKAIKVMPADQVGEAPTAESSSSPTLPCATGNITSAQHTSAGMITSGSSSSTSTGTTDVKRLGIFSSGHDEASDSEDSLATQMARQGTTSGKFPPKLYAGPRSTRTGLSSNYAEDCRVAAMASARRRPYAGGGPLATSSALLGSGISVSDRFHGGGSSSTGGKLQEQTEAKEFICYLCIRKFASEEMLKKHEELSALHKKNLLAQAAETNGLKAAS
eukprot:GHVQ01002819.1.p1 GENE.GHVQ01002819.1~~GHVQ01002819.1.p1  ORF type:complete len:953 (-),score=163.30 GHVQ01002819.1:142-3000(-)